MRIIHVTPLSKSPLAQLSYFSANDIPEGSIISVPIRKKNVPALVLRSEDARSIKSILRTNLYETKKIKDPKPVFAFSKAFIAGAEQSAKYFATNTGAIIRSSVPTAIFNALNTGILNDAKHKITSKPNTLFEKNSLQLPRSDRIERYKILIRARFAKKQSIFLCVPTIRDTKYFASKCSNGIEQYTYVLDSSLSEKKQQSIWQSILLQKHPVLIIATTLFASIPREDIALFIIEDESSSAYKQQKRPYADTRILIEHTAKIMGATLLYTGTSLSLQIHKALNDGTITPLEETNKRLRSKSTCTLINTKEKRQLAKEAKLDFPVLSDDTMEALLKTHSGGKLSFVFAPRRGISSHTVCNDCEATVICAKCGAPMVLHEYRASRNLLCHRCGSARDANETCRICGSWNLMPLGIGIQKVEHYINAHLPQIPLYVLSADVASTSNKAQKIATEFYKTEGAVLIGTEMAINYIDNPINLSVMASIDSLLCIPDFKIEEKIFGIVAKLREHTSDQIFIETTDPDTTMLTHARDGAVVKYVAHELALRKKLLYPPYTLIIKVTCSGTRLGVIDIVKTFIERANKYNPRVFAGFIKNGINMELNILIRIPTNEWPDEQLGNILKGLPPQCKIDINPGRTL